MKKLLGAVSAALAVATVLSVPASALAILTGDSFSKGSKSDWVTDVYEPDEFDNSDNELYLTVGKGGFTKNRPAEQKAKAYAIQGKKIATKKPTSNTWTAVVKINLDSQWFGSTSQRKRAEFRVDLVDGKGNPVDASPAIAILKDTSGDPEIRYYNSKYKSGWGAGDKFVNGDKEMEYFTPEEDWHSLIIHCKDGIVSYYIDEKKIGNCTLPTKDVYPAFMALGAQNFEGTYTVNFDNCYLYNGSYTIRQRSTEAQDKRDDRLASKYQSKRDKWHSKYWDEERGKLTKDMPDSYWDY